MRIEWDPVGPIPTRMGPGVATTAYPLIKTGQCGPLCWALLDMERSVVLVWYHSGKRREKKVYTYCCHLPNQIGIFHRAGQLKVGQFEICTKLTSMASALEEQLPNKLLTAPRPKQHIFGSINFTPNTFYGFSSQEVQRIQMIFPPLDIILMMVHYFQFLIIIMSRALRLA